MAYPPRFMRHTSYRQQELAGAPINTANMDAEMNDIAEVIDQIITRFQGITSAAGRLRNVAEATAQALAGAQSFVAVAGQLVFNTTIVWDSSFTSSNCPVFLDGHLVAPSNVTISDNAGYVTVTLNAGLSSQVLNGSIVVVEAFSNGAGIASRLSDVSSVTNGANMVGVQDIDDLFYATTVEGCLREMRLLVNDFFATFGPSAYAVFIASASQLSYLTTIPWDAAYTPNNVRVYKNGALLPVADVSVYDNGGNLQVILDASVTVASGDKIEVSILKLADLITRDGRSIDGKGLRSDLVMSSDGTRHRIVGLEDGVDDYDGVNIRQLNVFGQSLFDLLSVFIRADGSVPFEASQSMGGFRLTDVGTPLVNSDAPNVGFVIGRMLAQVGLRAKLLDGVTPHPEEGTLTGPLTLGRTASDNADSDQTTNPDTVAVHTITGVPRPTADAQVANKLYVDQSVAASNATGQKRVRVARGQRETLGTVAGPITSAFETLLILNADVGRSIEGRTVIGGTLGYEGVLYSSRYSVGPGDNSFTEAGQVLVGLDMAFTGPVLDDVVLTYSVANTNENPNSGTQDPSMVNLSFDMGTEQNVYKTLGTVVVVRPAAASLSMTVEVAVRIQSIMGVDHLQTSYRCTDDSGSNKFVLRKSVQLYTA